LTTTATTETPYPALTPHPPRQPSPLNLANQLTFARFLLAILLFVQISQGWWLGAIITFALAALTDWLDGLAARWLRIGSTLGRNFDPLVDKILVCGAFTCLLPYSAEQTGLAPWMVVIVISRELLVTGLRSYMEQHYAAFGADWAGKIKMVLQCAALFAIFGVFWLASQTPPPIAPGPATLLRNLLILAMTLATVVSGLLYLRQAYLLYTRDKGL
jgi:CDP-diacylglycerol--glycerol-3-phosphate 3-phosphatidyltransferase